MQGYDVPFFWNEWPSLGRGQYEHIVKMHFILILRLNFSQSIGDSFVKKL